MELFKDLHIYKETDSPSNVTSNKNKEKSIYFEQILVGVNFKLILKKKLMKSIVKIGLWGIGLS